VLLGALSFNGSVNFLSSLLDAFFGASSFATFLLDLALSRALALAFSLALATAAANFSFFFSSAVLCSSTSSVLS
jgi:hypothetical protein